MEEPELVEEFNNSHTSLYGITAAPKSEKLKINTKQS